LCTATSTPPPYPLSLHDALPIYPQNTHLIRNGRLLPVVVRFRFGLQVDSGIVCDALDEGGGICTGCEFQPNAIEHRSAVGVFLKDRKSTRLNSSHVAISYAVFCL